MDFTKLENIIFTAVAGALALFLFIMAFYVISKGRRKTSGLDIFLRIVASLVLIVTAALFVLAIFTELTGSFRIAAAGDEAYFVIGDSVTKLPLGVIFVTLTTTTGQTIVIALFVIAFMTLVADCLLAKKKYGKKTQQVKKSPEELKREAELAKIRKLSDAAVKKSNSAANAADKTSTVDNDNFKNDNADKVEDDKVEEEQKPEEPEEDFDWRVDSQPKKSNNEFVGISNTTDDDFDSFDSFDEAVDEQEEHTEDPSEEHADFDSFDETEETVEAEETVESEDADVFEDAVEQDEADSHVDERPWYEQDDPADERIIAEALADDSKPSFAAGGYNETVETTETTTYYETTETTETVTEQSELDDIADVRDEYTEDADEYVETDNEEKRERAWYEEGNVDSSDEVESVVSEKTEIKAETESSYSDYYVASGSYDEASRDIEPDRDIYIPGIRTVNREPREEKKPEEKKAAAKPSTRASSRPATKPAISTARKPAAKKPTAKKPATAKPATKKPTKKPATKKPAAKKPIVTATSDPHKLPVTKRYIILDRTNAVNIFSKYLKEREQSEKDKLESSINTIIIK